MWTFSLKLYVCVLPLSNGAEYVEVQRRIPTGILLWFLFYFSSSTLPGENFFTRVCAEKPHIFFLFISFYLFYDFSKLRTHTKLILWYSGLVKPKSVKYSYKQLIYVWERREAYGEVFNYIDEIYVYIFSFVRLSIINSWLLLCT